MSSPDPFHVAANVCIAGVIDSIAVNITLVSVERTTIGCVGHTVVVVV
jgi:hypothetical protein